MVMVVRSVVLLAIIFHTHALLAPRFSVVHNSLHITTRAKSFAILDIIATATCGTSTNTCDDWAVRTNGELSKMDAEHQDVSVRRRFMNTKYGVIASRIGAELLNVPIDVCIGLASDAARPVLPIAEEGKMECRDVEQHRDRALSAGGE